MHQENIRDFIKWSNFVGIFNIVLGGLAALAGVAALLVGAAPGVLMIIAGIKLLNAKRAAEELLGIEDPAMAIEKFNVLLPHTTSFFKYQGLYYIVAIIMSILGIILWFTLAALFYSEIEYY